MSESKDSKREALAARLAQVAVANEAPAEQNAQKIAQKHLKATPKQEQASIGFSQADKKRVVDITAGVFLHLRRAVNRTQVVLAALRAFETLSPADQAKWLNEVINEK